MTARVIYVNLTYPQLGVMKFSYRDMTPFFFQTSTGHRLKMAVMEFNLLLEAVVSCCLTTTLCHSKTDLSHPPLYSGLGLALSKCKQEAILYPIKQLYQNVHCYNL